MDVKGFLVDLDGVLYTGEQAIDGAHQAIELIREKKIPVQVRLKYDAKVQKNGI